MEEEGLGVEAAVRAVLEDNLHGLEIDSRCTQIAAFNLALSAWRDGWAPHRVAAAADCVFGPCPERHQTRSGCNWPTATSGSKALSTGCYGLFEQATGPRIAHRSARLSERICSRPTTRRPSVRWSERSAHEDAGDEERERAVAAQGISRAAKLLAGEYDLVITNVPYLARMVSRARALHAFADRNHPDAKADLATALRLANPSGGSAIAALKRSSRRRTGCS